MGGKGGAKADNSAVVNEQRQQAAEAAAKEAARQERLKTGLASIKNAFEGSPVMASQQYDWSGFKPPETMPPAMSAWLAQNKGTAAPDFSKTGSVPAGYTAAQIPGVATGGATSGARRMLNGVDLGPAGPAAGQAGQGVSASVWGLKDASGKTYRPGDPLSYQTDTGQTTGGFDDAFYNKYKQSVLDYYMPQVDDQYKKAKEQATYGLARSGNIRSSAANTLTSDLSKQNDINLAGVRNQADTASGDLRNQVASERAKATSQLYATEDPEVAANQALAAVSNINLKQPDFSPLSQLFNVATIGGANVLKGYKGQQNLNTFNAALPQDKSTIHGNG